MAVLVMSSVALVYLTVIIYLPAQRELQSGIRETSVMCTTVENKDIVDDIFACRSSHKKPENIFIQLVTRRTS